MAKQPPPPVLPPHSVEAEEAVTGSFIIDPDKVLEIEIDPADFYISSYGLIVGAIQSLSRRGVAADIITIADELERRGQLEDVGGAAKLTDLINATPTSMHAEHYAAIVTEMAEYRRIIQTATEMAQSAYAKADEPAQIIAEANKSLLSSQGMGTISSAGDIIDGLYYDIEQVMNKPLSIIGIPTGLKDIDRLTGGLQKGDVIIIAGRPGMGKTALATQIAVDAALNQKSKPLIFSLEMSKKQLMQRIISPRIGVSTNDIRCGRIKSDQFAEFTKQTSVIRDSGLFIDGAGYVTPAKLRAAALRHQARHGCDLIIIDYLQLMSGDTRNPNKHQEISEITRSCKNLAREMDVPIMLLSQLSRSVENRADKRPMLSDLRESGAIEADADQVWFLFREAYYNKNVSEESKNVCEVIVAKNRNGPTGISLTYFDAEFTQFKDLSTITTELGW